MHGQDLVECYQADNVIEARLLAERLGEQGIRAMADNQDLQQQLGPLDGNPRIWVQAKDYDRARAILEAYESERRERRNSAD